MGRRNLTMVISNGQTKVAQYGQWDGYPTGQGSTALSFLHKVVSDGELAKFKDCVDSIKWLTEEQVEQIDKDNNWVRNYPYLSRDAGADILNAIYYGKLEVNEGFNTKKVTTVDVLGLQNGEDFAADSLFCEWAYVIDLDKGTFEAYKGFNKSPLTEDDRFYPMQVENKHFEERRKDDQYYPVKLVRSYQLTDLPTTSVFCEE